MKYKANMRKRSFLFKMVSSFFPAISILIFSSCATGPPTSTPHVIIPTAPLVMPPTPLKTEIFTETAPAPTVMVAVTTATPAPTNTQQSRPPGQLVFGQRSEPDTLHPLLGSMMGKDIINSALFADCTRLTPGGEWIPEMCTEVPTLQNGGARWVGSGAELHLEVTFRLRKDWKWHDGQPVTAADYVYTWKLALDSGLDSGIGIMVPQRNAWELVQNVSALDTQTVVIQYHSESSLKAAAAGQGRFPGLHADYQKLKETIPTGPAASPFYFSLGSPLPEHILGSILAMAQYDNAYGHRPVGNGAYRFIEWIPGSEVVLGANLDFPFGAPHFQSLTIRFYLSKDEMMSDLQKGVLDG
jgi:peptide/nickel transport system substrate-binding protein